MMPLYAVAKSLCRAGVGLYNGFCVAGLENIPRKGPAIIVANHVTLLDPVVLGAAAPRQIYFMAKKELFDNPVCAKALSMLGAFRVRRGEADREAIRVAEDLLERGRLVGMFIEGTRNPTEERGFLPPQPGAAMLALKTGAPIIPVALVNMRDVFRKFRVPAVVRVGKALTGFAREGKHRLIYDAIGAQIMQAIAGLYNGYSVG